MQTEDINCEDIKLPVGNASSPNIRTIKEETCFTTKNDSHLPHYNGHRIRTGITYVEEQHRKPFIELPIDEEEGSMKCQCPYCGVIRQGKFSIGKVL